MIKVNFPSKPFTVDSLFASRSKLKGGPGITRTGLFLKVKRAVKGGQLVVVGLKAKPKVKGVSPKGRRSVVYAVAPVATPAVVETPVVEVAEVAPVEAVTEATSETVPASE